MERLKLTLIWLPTGPDISQTQSVSDRRRTVRNPR